MMLGESYIETLHLLANRILTGNLAPRQCIMTYKIIFFSFTKNTRPQLVPSLFPRTAWQCSQMFCQPSSSFPTYLLGGALIFFFQFNNLQYVPSFLVSLNNSIFNSSLMSSFLRPEVFLTLTLLFQSVTLFRPTWLYQSLKQANQAVVDSHSV